MRIGIDARFLTHPQAGGFKSYTQNLVAALARQDSENEYLLYLDRNPEPGEPALQALEGCKNFKLQVVEGALPMFGMLWREQVHLVRQAHRDQLDVLHAPALTAPLQLKTPLVVTMHDMIWRFPDKFAQPGGARGLEGVKRKLMESYYRHIPEAAARRAKALIAVSQASRLDILQHLPVDPKRVFVIHNAVGAGFGCLEERQPLEAMRIRRELPEEYLLALGSADPRKNISSLVEAYALLPLETRQRYPLAIVWTHRLLAGAISQRIERLGLEGQVHFLTDVSNEELALLYNGAALFVFPSHYEGFGLPVLEAMACGTPVAAANNSSIPEVAGGAAELFDETQPQAIANAIQRVLSNPTHASEMRQAGLRRASEFSWDRCGRETLEIYRKVVAR